MSSTRRFYLLTMPRTASNLLIRMLGIEDQPDIVPRQFSGYFFIDALMKTNMMNLRRKHVDGWNPEEKARMKQCYQECFNALDEYIKKADAEGKIAFVKEHVAFMLDPTATSRRLSPAREIKESPTTVQIPGSDEIGAHSPNNHTVLPDEFLKTFQPILLIRHPALVFTSVYRKMDELKSLGEIGRAALLPEPEVSMTLKWMRGLYDFYSDALAGDATYPTVLDADDIINHPEIVMQLCEVIGLDKTKLKFSWDPVTGADLDRKRGLEKVMLSSIFASSGVMKDKAATELDIGVEAKNWRLEFGESKGEEIETFVREAMPDYEFLRSKRMIPSGNSSL